VYGERECRQEPDSKTTEGQLPALKTVDNNRFNRC